MVDVREGEDAGLTVTDPQADGRDPKEAMDPGVRGEGVLHKDVKGEVTPLHGPVLCLAMREEQVLQRREGTEAGGENGAVG